MKKRNYLNITYTAIIWAVMLAVFFSFTHAHAGELPDDALTPGWANPAITEANVGTIKWGKDKRLVTEAMKKQVIEAYHFDVSTCPLSRYMGGMVRRVEIDHLWSRELGGADDIRNLWPQCYEDTQAIPIYYGAHAKDKLENYLHAQVVIGKMTLVEAQRKLSDNWIETYKNVYGE